MMPFLTLDKKGVISAVALAVLILFFGKDYNIFFLAMLVLFLVLSAIATNLGKEKKKKLGVYEKSRGWKNVAANGLIPLLIVILFYFSPAKFQELLIYGYIASIAAITADKFASEIGVLDGVPIMLLTLKKVQRGTSGGVTGLGLFASFIAAVVVSLPVLLFTTEVRVFVFILLSGFIGNIVDSVLGYFEEKGVGNKFTTNLACSLSGFIIAMLLLTLYG